jgi:segregation and condensation protein A
MTTDNESTDTGSTQATQFAPVDTAVPSEVVGQTKTAAQQSEMPFAVVSGKVLTEMPMDLYIPPQALEVFLDAFEGPLDLLLYLIKKQNLDILAINVLEITRQYMKYVEMMQSMNLELAADYLVMAAMLGEIKSRILLPRPESMDEEEADPRAELIRRLQEYERFKTAAENLDALPRSGRDFFVRAPNKPLPATPKEPEVALNDVLIAFGRIIGRSEMFEKHQITREVLSTRERMSQVLEQLKGQAFVPFVALYKESEGRLGVAVTFIAIMELCKEGLIDLIQNDTYGPIHIKARAL